MLKILDRLEEWLIGVLIGAATLIIFVAVVHRYTLDMAATWEWDALYDALFLVNLGWAQELTIYLFVWMAKFGAAYGVRTGIHVGVDVLINNLKESVRSKFVLFGLFAGALFTGTVGSFGVTFVWHLSHTAQTTPDLEMPVWIVYLAIPLGSYLMCFRFLQVAWSFYRIGELPQHDHARVEGLEEEVEAAQALGREEKVYVGEAVSLTEEREHIHGGLPEDGRSGHKSDKGEERP